MKCVVCKSTDTKLLKEKFPGYVEETYYSIYSCQSCISHFIENNKNEKDLYEKIYSLQDIQGFDRYFKYIKEVKQSENPLKFLAKTEAAYYPIYHYLQDQKTLNVLDVGCGYGYLTYAINQSGHNALGVDVSKNAIEIGIKNFGINYLNAKLEDLSQDYERKFDLIIATELIEHLNDIEGFLENCLRLLNNNGKIYLSTPNKDFYPKQSLWKTESPPVHTVWLGKKSIQKLASVKNLDCEFFKVDPNNYTEENLLMSIILSKINQDATPVLSADYKVLKNTNYYKNHKAKSIIKKILKNSILRSISNSIARLLTKESSTIFAFLTKKN